MSISTDVKEGEPKENRQGRPRDPHVDAAARRAALDLLVEEGFARMSMEGVAARAGVGKAAIYRRWDNKTALVLDAVHELLSPHLGDWPHTDDIRADLEAIYRLFMERVMGTEGGMMRAVASEMARYPEMAKMIKEQFVACRKADLVERIRSAQAGGELPAGDTELMAEVGFAIIFHRALLSDAPLSAELPERLVRQFFPT